MGLGAYFGKCTEPKAGGGGCGALVRVAGGVTCARVWLWRGLLAVFLFCRVLLLDVWGLVRVLFRATVCFPTLFFFFLKIPSLLFFILM